MVGLVRVGVGRPLPQPRSTFSIEPSHGGGAQLERPVQGPRPGAARGGRGLSDPASLDRQFERFVVDAEPASVETDGEDRRTGKRSGSLNRGMPPPRTLSGGTQERPGGEEGESP